MGHIIENEYLKIEACEKGAELASVYDKKKGKELLWQADPEYWNGKAPVLFPWCGRLLNGELSHNGNKAQADRHGFARNSIFEMKESENSLLFELCDNEETRAVYPYGFRLEIEYFLEGKTLTQQVRVYNTGGVSLPFSVGFHPGFALDKGRSYCVLFEKEESPQLILTPGGFVSGEKKKLFTNNNRLDLKDDIFAEDSLCMAGLKSSWLQLKNNDTGDGVRVYIEGFEYCLLWGPPAGPLPFVCIEPWHSLPDPTEEYGDFENKPGLFSINSGESYKTRLKMEFID